MNESLTSKISLIFNGGLHISIRASFAIKPVSCDSDMTGLVKIS